MWAPLLKIKNYHPTPPLSLSSLLHPPNHHAPLSLPTSPTIFPPTFTYVFSYLKESEDYQLWFLKYSLNISVNNPLQVSVWETEREMDNEKNLRRRAYCWEETVMMMMMMMKSIFIMKRRGDAILLVPQSLQEMSDLCS